MSFTPSQDSEENSDSQKSKVNGDTENGDANDTNAEKNDKKRKSEESVMEIMDSDDDDSKQSTHNEGGESKSADSVKAPSSAKQSDANESSQDSVANNKAESKATESDSDIEMIEDDDNDGKPASSTGTAVEEANNESAKPADPDKNKVKEQTEEAEEKLPAKEPERELTPEEIAKKKAEQAKLAKYAVMDKPAEILDMRPMAHLLHDIGMDLCRESVYGHLIKVQNKKLSQNKLGDTEIEQLGKLKDAHTAIQKKNGAFDMEPVKCPTCPFKTESQNVLEWHLEFAHGQDEESYACSFCEFTTKMPGAFFYHMEDKHKRKGRIYMRSAQFSCPLCPFENNKRPTMTKHRQRCEKAFRASKNLEPAPTDCDIPLKKTKKQMQVSILCLLRAC